MLEFNSNITQCENLKVTLIKCKKLQENRIPNILLLFLELSILEKNIYNHIKSLKEM